MFAERPADFIPGAYVNVIREVEGTDRMTFVNHNRPLPPVTIEDLNERESFDERGCVNSELKVCLVKPDFRFGTAVGILDQDKVTRRTACTAQGSGSWQSRPTSSST